MTPNASKNYQNNFQQNQQQQQQFQQNAYANSSNNFSSGQAGHEISSPEGGHGESPSIQNGASSNNRFNNHHNNGNLSVTSSSSQLHFNQSKMQGGNSKANQAFHLRDPSEEMINSIAYKSI